MKALAILQQMDFDAKKDLFENVPEYAISKTKYSDTTANGLTRAVLSFLKLKGHMAWRQSSEGRYRPGKSYVDVIGRSRIMKGNYLPGQNNGQSDVAAIVAGQFVAVEVKMKDKQSELQKQYQQQVQDNGGRYVIVRTFEEFYNWYNNLNHI